MPSFKDFFPDKWLKASVINGYRPRVVIESVTVEQVFNPRSKKHERKLAIKFHKKDLLLLLNKTQCNALASICRTEDYDKWAGFEVVLSTTKAPNGADTIVISPVPDAPATPKATPVEEARIDDAEDLIDFDANADMEQMWEPEL